ncbi:hypothetical protein [Sphingopyxis solisilvae]|uniref:hypothetical protein n=1 Tax=Sphingopyxis solisilvae TaxID=1886788 RepID=UPI0018928EAE|nr:hypothetical protein [Sphingopyxis solisilvae]
MRRCHHNSFLFAVSASLALPIVACGDAEKLPVDDSRPSLSNAAGGCSAARFSYLENLKAVHHDSADPIVEAAWIAAADAAGERRDSFASEHCSVEVRAPPDNVRCFQFYMKEPAPGGAIQLCLDDNRKVSRIHLDE